jgi:Na+/pantothenate symporter
MSNNSIVIQLNASAVAHLIETGGDEFRVKLQDAVVANIAGKYLKPIVNAEITQAAIASVRSDIEFAIACLKSEILRQLAESVGKVVKTSSGAPRIFEISSEVRTEIQEIVRDRRSEFIDEVIQNCASSVLSDEAIQATVERRIADLVKSKYANEIIKTISANIGKLSS